MSDEAKQLLTAAEVAKRFGVVASTVISWYRQRKDIGPFVEVGGKTILFKASIVEYLENDFRRSRGRRGPGSARRNRVQA